MEDKSIGVWAVAALVLVGMIIFGLVAGNFSTKLSDLKSEVNGLETTLNSVQAGPSAQEIASLIVIPNVEMPEVPEFKSDQKVHDLWKKLYGEDVDALEDLALALALDKVDEEKEDELLDYLELEFPGLDDLISFSEDDDERDVIVLDLGIDDEEDQSVRVTLEYKFKYDLKEGVDDDFKGRLYITANVVWDDDEEELVAEDLIYSL